ncbi:MAG: tryptophan synthase subunit alpha [Candidatus Magnetominusculus sp. LBB02]|nr:tryptophan synthase subunit alpha [Candidatus Magnetominusculus sp. LBB02]
MAQSAITEIFRKMKEAGNGAKAFIPYIMAGEPSLNATLDIVLELEAMGADIVELGVPFSDPVADGPTIQQAAMNALSRGVTLHNVIDLVGAIRKKSQIPIVLMTYFNPVLRFGLNNFIEASLKSGVDGIIIPDLPPDEETDFIASCHKNGPDTIFLLAPTSTDVRIGLVSEKSRGFIYYVSVTGITGADISIDAQFRAQIDKIRMKSNKPVAVGFGVKTADEAAKVAAIADGVIVGSAIVKAIGQGQEQFRALVKSLRAAIHAVV